MPDTPIAPEQVRIQRAYAPPTPQDGARILIDRLWPRGIKKEALQLTEWAKPLAPSTELRKWFNHEPAKWEAFCHRYAAELRAQPQAWQALRAQAQAGVVTLIYAAHDETMNNAVAVRSFLLHPESLNPDVAA